MEHDAAHTAHRKKTETPKISVGWDQGGAELHVDCSSAMRGCFQHGRTVTALQRAGSRTSQLRQRPDGITPRES
jgi:hypothetical protein